MADLNDEVNAVTANLSRLSSEFDRYSRLTSSAADSSRELSAVQRAQSAASRSASDSLYSLQKASGSLGSSLYEGRRGMQAFSTATAATAESVGSFIQTLSKAAGALGNNALFKGFMEGLGKLSGGSVKVAATLYDLASNMADRQYDAYSKLTDTGAIASEGMTGVGDAAEKLGLNILKMDEYIGLVNQNSKELAAFGRSAFDGRRKFENLGQALEKDRQAFFALGMTQDQVNESMMGYIRLQNLSGRSQKINNDELIAGTRKYLYEQDALAKLLGMSRKEQQSAREAALSEQRFGAKIAAMRASGDAQQIAAADELEKQNLVLAKVSPELAQGFRDLTTGMINTEAAQKANTSTQGQIVKDTQDVMSGLKSGGEGAYSSLQALAKTSEKFNMAYQAGTGENFLVKFAETQQARQFLEKDFNTEMAKILDERKKLTSEDGKDKKEGGDPRLIGYAALLKDQQQIMVALQSLVNKGVTINLSDGSKIKLSADTVVDIQKGITKEIIDYLQNNPYFKLDVRNAGKTPVAQIVSADTDLKKAQLENARADESKAQAIKAEELAKKSLREEMEKTALLEKAVKAGKASQADLDAEKKKLQEAADRAKIAETNRVAAEKQLEAAEKQLAVAKQRDEAAKKTIKPAAEAPKPEAAKPEPAKPEEPKAKPEAAKPEPVKPKPEAAKPEPVKPKPEAAKPEPVKPKPEAAKPEPVKPDEQGLDKKIEEILKKQEDKPVAPKPDAVKPEEIKPEPVKPKPEVLKIEAPKIEVPKIEAPKPEPVKPKIEAPKPESVKPKPEAVKPKIEAPKPEPVKPKPEPVKPKPEPVKPKVEAPKPEAVDPAKITLLPNGARVLEDVLELFNKGVPIISNFRTKEEQEALKHHQDDKGRSFTKDDLPVGENSKHLSGDAIDVDTNKMTKEFAKILQDSGWRRPMPKDDPGHYERISKPKDKKSTETVAPKDQRATNVAPLTADQVAALNPMGANNKNIPGVADLTINSDVATLNSKGMNVALDNPADVARMLTETMTIKTDAEKKDQSAARTSFENSMGDVKSALTNQQDTNQMLLSAIQELIRVQRSGVSVNEKILAAQA